jgi:hypothetical protein
MKKFEYGLIVHMKPIMPKEQWDSPLKYSSLQEKSRLHIMQVIGTRIAGSK